MNQFSMSSLIENDIRQMIESGKFKPGDILPSEQELSQKYKVSRMTGRKALERLSYDGLIYREVGRGSFVAKKKMTLQLGFIHSIEKQLQSQGYTPLLKVIDSSIDFSPLDVAESLAITPASNVYRLDRQKIRASGTTREVYGFERRYFPTEIADSFTEEDLRLKNVFDLLDKDPRNKVARMSVIVGAQAATGEIPQVLEISAGYPVIVRKTTMYAYNNRPIQYGVSYFRSDRYELFLEYKM